MIRLIGLLFVLASVSLGDDALPDFQDIAASSKPSEPLPRYKRLESVSGKVRITGSATVGGLLAGLVRPLGVIYPELKFERKFGDDAATLKSLLDGAADIGAFGRPMTKEEVGAFEKKFSYPPTPVLLGVDALTIVVNRKNPIKGLTLKQVDRLFSAERKRGGERVATWGDLGLEAVWKTRVPWLYGLGVRSASNLWMRARVLRGGAFDLSVRVQPGSGAVVNACGAYVNAIGYASRSYKTRRTRFVPIAESEGKPFVLPTRAACLKGTYALHRAAYLYVNRPPHKELPPHVAEFLAFASSASGQRVVERAGGHPIYAAIARHNLKAIGR